MIDPITRELDRSLATHCAIVKAIVCLNFNEHEKALDILLGALSDYNFVPRNSVRPAAKEAA